MLNVDILIRRFALVIIKIANAFYKKIVQKNSDSVLKKQELKFLIINPQGYGDTIVMTPLLRNLFIQFPKAEISVVCSGRGLEVLKNCPYIEHLYIYGEKTSEYLSLLKSIRKRNIDICLDLQLSLNSIKRWIFPLLTKSGLRVCFKRNGFEGAFPHLEVPYFLRHMVDCYLSIGEPFFSSPPNKHPEIFLSVEDKKWACKMMKNNINQPKIILHTYSENPNHTWKTELWVSLAENLAADNDIYFTSPPMATNYVREIVSQIKCPAKVIVPNNINQLAALIKNSDLLISVDTSTVHIASATNTQSVVIYGPTITTAWGPLNKNQISLQKNVVCGGHCRVFNDAIFSHIELCRKFKDNCINYITVEEVLQAINTLGI